MYYSVAEEGFSIESDKLPFVSYAHESDAIKSLNKLKEKFPDKLLKIIKFTEEQLMQKIEAKNV